MISSLREAFEAFAKDYWACGLDLRYMEEHDAYVGELEQTAWAAYQAASAPLIEQITAMKHAAIRAHSACYEAMLENPDVATLSDTGKLHCAIHEIIGVDTPECGEYVATLLPFSSNEQ